MTEKNFRWGGAHSPNSVSYQSHRDCATAKADLTLRKWGCGVDTSEKANNAASTRHWYSTERCLAGFSTTTAATFSIGAHKSPGGTEDLHALESRRLNTEMTCPACALRLLRPGTSCVGLMREK